MKNFLFMALTLLVFNSCNEFVLSKSICEKQKSVNLGLQDGAYILSSQSPKTTAEYSDVLISSFSEKNNKYSVDLEDNFKFIMKTCSIGSKVYGELKNEDGTYSVYNLYHDDMGLNIVPVSFDLSKLKDLKIKYVKSNSMTKDIVINNENSSNIQKILKASLISDELGSFTLYR